MDIPQGASLTILSTHTVSSGNAYFRIAIVAAIRMKPEHVLAGLIVEYDLGPLNDAVRSQVPAAGPGEQRADVLPLHEIIAGIAIHILKRRAAGFVFANEIEGTINANHPGAVSLNMLPIVLGRLSDGNEARIY